MFYSTVYLTTTIFKSNQTHCLLQQIKSLLTNINCLRGGGGAQHPRPPLRGGV